MSDRLDDLQERLGHRFARPGLLEQALRHGSAPRAAGEESYERLEFLGDAVLGAAVALLLYREHPEWGQGELTRARASLVRSETLAVKAYDLGLEQLVEVGASEGSRARGALLEDVYEAVIGALMLDAGWAASEAFVAREFAADVAALDPRSLTFVDAKSALQEAAQARGLPLPEYREVRSGGPDHRPLWVFEVVWAGEELARGEGRTKREAQQQAARRALVRLGLT